MADPMFFFDTYALIERQRGDPNHAPYANLPVFTHQMNIYEFVAAVLRDFDEARARAEVRRIAPNTLEADTDDLFAAAHARRALQVSYVDALGYVLARRHGLRFLTGDQRFAGVEGVEHVPRAVA